MAQGGNSASDSSSALCSDSAVVGTTRQTQRRNRGFSVCQDDGKGGPRGYDAGKKVWGRKRHLLVDTQGLLIRVGVHPADVQDRQGAQLLLKNISETQPYLKWIWADGAYAGKLQDWLEQGGGGNPIYLQIVKRSDKAKGFQVLPRRWVVERTLAWIGRWRRLSKDYEVLPRSSETLIYLSMTHLMLRRLSDGAFSIPS